MRRSIVWITALPALFVIVAVLGYQPAHAAGVVTDCSNDVQLRSLLAGGGSVTFNCNGTNSPAVIVVNPPLSVVTGTTTLDGGGKVTLSGAASNRLFIVDAGLFGSPLDFTLTHITLTNGYAGAGYAGYGGCMVIGFQSTVVLDDVTVRNCRTESGAQGGGIDNSLGNLTVRNSRVLNNAAGTGGGIRSFSFITLTNTLLASNRAITGTGGGLHLVQFGFAKITGSTFYSNAAAVAGGGLYFEQSAQATLVDSLLNGNTATSGGGLLNSGTATLNNSTLSGNTATDGGGGLANHGTATLTSTTVSGNTASRGGGLFNYFGTATLNNVTLSGNTASGGGGLFNYGAVTLNNSTLSGNAATYGGGGFYNIRGYATLNNVTLSGNTASGNGGGIYNYSNATLNNSTLSGNTASSNGGGIYNGDAATLNNSTLSGNTASSNGGGLYVGYPGVMSKALLRNVTVSNNGAPVGGGLYISPTAQVALTNTILAYSPSGGNCYGSITSSKFTFSSDNSCALPPGNTIKGQNPNGLDPLLSALGNYGGPTQVQMPKAASPAVGGIVGFDAPMTDQRGLPRPGPDGSYDIGAVERQPGDIDLAPRLYVPVIRR